MLMFGGFFVAAVVYRKRPRLHRPLMVVAAASLLVAAVSRMAPLLPAEPYGGPTALLIWSSPLLVAMGQEFRSTDRVHPIYFLGIAAFVVRRYSRGALAETDAWREFAHAVFALVS